MKIFILLFLFSFTTLFSQETYKVGTTEYYVGEYYTTGHKKVKRSESNKRKFLESKGYKDTPEGYEIDHIIPLSEGGTDDPSNMQLLTVAEHRSKTSQEASKRHTVANPYNSVPSTTSNTSTNTSTTTTTSTSTYYTPNSTSTSSSSSSPKTVQVKGYTRKDGTYVKPHTRSAPKKRN